MLTTIRSIAILIIVKQIDLADDTKEMGYVLVFTYCSGSQYPGFVL